GCGLCMLAERTPPRCQCGPGLTVQDAVSCRAIAVAGSAESSGCEPAWSTSASVRVEQPEPQAWAHARHEKRSGSYSGNSGISANSRSADAKRGAKGELRRVP